MLLVNFFAGPGAGKSIMSARVYAALKDQGISVEHTIEYAKDLVWQKRFDELACQPKVFGEQLWRIESLRNTGVQVCLTDSPVLLQAAYSHWGEEFAALARAAHKRQAGMNFFIQRTKPYDPRGRNESEKEARQKDREIFDLLFGTYTGGDVVTGDEIGAQFVTRKILERLGGRPL